MTQVSSKTNSLKIKILYSEFHKESKNCPSQFIRRGDECITVTSNEKTEFDMNFDFASQLAKHLKKENFWICTDDVEKLIKKQLITFEKEKTKNITEIIKLWLCSKIIIKN